MPRTPPYLQLRGAYRIAGDAVGEVRRLRFLGESLDLPLTAHWPCAASATLVGTLYFVDLYFKFLYKG